MFAAQSPAQTFVYVVEHVLQQHPVALLGVIKAVQSPLLQQGLSVAVDVCGEEAGEPLLQQRVDVVHHLTQQNTTYRGRHSHL